MAQDLTNDITELALNENEAITWDDTDDDERYFDLTFADEKCVLLFHHTDASADDETVTVKIIAGDFFQEGYGDIEFTIEKDEYHAVIFDSAVVKNEDGEVEIKLFDDSGDALGTGTSEGEADDIEIAVLHLG